MNQFSLFEALNLSGDLNIVIMGLCAGAVFIVGSIIYALAYSGGWDGCSIFLLAIGIIGLLSSLFIGYSSYTFINEEYNEIMAVDTTREYTALQVYKEFGVEKPDGLYQIDLSEMDKELYSQIKRDDKDPYDFILKKVSGEADEEVIAK